MSGELTSSLLFQNNAPSILGLLNSALPNNMNTVRSGINQQLLTPSFRKFMESAPRGQGVSFNSPNRVMQSAMATADQAGGNANARSMGLLGAEWQNMFTQLENDARQKELRNTLNAVGDQQYLNNTSYLQDASQSAQGQLMQLLGPMFGSLAGSY